MQTLVLNSGSSSLRFALFEEGNSRALASGLAECLNSDEARLTLKHSGGKLEVDMAGANHEEALRAAVYLLKEQDAMSEDPAAIGHRIVHGGEYFSEPALIDDVVLGQIDSCCHLAPLHNPSGVLGVKVAQQIFPSTPQVAVFDTSFHQTIPEHAYLYAIPRELHKEHGVRRYGFHGTSHSYVSTVAAELLDFSLSESKILSAHLGNGCSCTAILNGESVETTMGFTPLEGLAMGTRSGDVDPGVLLFLGDQLGMSSAEISELLNKKSGLLGLSGISNDMRELRAHADQGSADAALAIEIFCYRVAKALAGLTVALGGLDVLIFTGGIGENDARTRRKVLECLAFLGLAVDGARNDNHGTMSGGVITTDGSRVRAVVVQTNEELMISQLTKKALSGKK